MKARIAKLYICRIATPGNGPLNASLCNTEGNSYQVSYQPGTIRNQIVHPNKQDNGTHKNMETFILNR